METLPTELSPEEATAIFMVYGIAFVATLVVALAISAVVAFLFKKNYDVIPPEHRKLNPTSKVWFLLIPLFNLYWLFVVVLGLSDSYKSYFDANGITDVGDCFRQLGLWLCITTCCTIIPCVNYLTTPASLVLLIIYLVKVFELKKRVDSPLVA